MVILPQLYQPSDAEISAVTASAKCRWPQLSSRIDKAAEILSDGGLELEPAAWDVRNVVHWRIASQSHAGSYIVPSAVGAGYGLGCPCQDKRADFCKHAIAVACYLKVLNNRINGDIRAREIDLGILPDHSFNAYAWRMGHVHMNKVGTAYAFADAASAVRYSLWLAAREAVTISLPVEHNAVVALAA